MHLCCITIGSEVRYLGADKLVNGNYLEEYSQKEQTELFLINIAKLVECHQHKRKKDKPQRLVWGQEISLVKQAVDLGGKR